MKGRVEQLIAEMTATRARVDTLTDAMTTLHGLVSERLTDLGEVVSRSREQTLDQVTEIVAAATPVIPNFDSTLGRWRTSMAADVDKALTRFQGQTARHLDEAMMETQARVSEDIDAAVTRSQNQATSQLDEVTARWQAQSSRQADRLQQRYEQTTATIGGMATNQDRRIDRLVEAVSAEVAAVGQQLSDQASVSATTQQTELAGVVKAIETAMVAGQEQTQTGTAGLTADVTALTDTVADALVQVADRLECLVQRNTGQEDMVEAVADALDDLAGRVGELDQAGQSRHDHLMALIGEVRSARSDQSVDLGPVTTALANEAVQALNAAGEQVAEQIRAAATPPAGQSSVTAMTRIEGRLSELTRQREENEQATRATLDALETTVGRLASAQAEDLERILDTVEGLATPADIPASQSEGDSQRLVRIEAELGALARQPAPVLPADTESAVGEQLASLGSQMEALRRRLAVRARTPALDDDAIDALADAVAARLAATKPMRPIAARPATKARPDSEAAGGSRRRRTPES